MDTYPSIEQKHPHHLRSSRQALGNVGLSILASAGSTAGACAFLLLCTIQVLKLLGTIILANTIVSCVFALVVLPVLLSYMKKEEVEEDIVGSTTVVVL